MQLTISRSVLRPAVTRAASTADAAATSGGVTGMVRLRATGSLLSVTSTDLRITAISVLPCKVERPGSLLVDAERFAGVIAKAPGDEVSLSFSERVVTIKSGKSRVELLCQADRDFPSVPDIDQATFAPCSPTLLAGMIDLASTTLGNDDSRPATFGALFRCGSPSARMVTFRDNCLTMAVADLALPEHAPVVVPPDGVKAIVGLVRDADECSVGFAGSHVVVRAGDTVLAVKLADVTFAAYEQVLASIKPTYRVTVDRKALIGALDRAAFMTEKNTEKVAHGVVVGIAADAIAIDATHAEYGKAHEDLEADATGKGVPVQFGVQPKFLRDALSALSSDQVAIEGKGPLDPIMVRAVGGGESVGVIMPMRI